MKKVIFVKLGGGLITDKTKPYTARPSVIRRLAQEIYTEWSKNEYYFILGNGAGSFGHVEAARYSTKDGFTHNNSRYGFAVVQQQVSHLNRIVVDALITEGIPAISISPSSALVAKNHAIDTWCIEPIIELLNKNMVPVIYGDVVVDTQVGCSIFSTDRLFQELALRLRERFPVHSVMHLGITDGVLDEKKQTIPTISNHNYGTIQYFVNGSRGIDVTGGMRTKLEESMQLANAGITTYIVNGMEKAHIHAVISGEKFPGTIIHNI